MSKEAPRILARRTAFDGWNRLEIWSVQAKTAAGRVETHEREVVDHGNAGVVLAVDRDRGTALLVKQWRAPLLDAGVDPYLLEACAGIIDPGESPEQTAAREAEEEIGLRLRNLRHVADVFPSAGTLTERMHLYVADIARQDRTAPGGGKAGEGEDIEVVEIPLGELFAMARAGKILDAKTLILVQALLIETLEAGQSPSERPQEQ